MIRREIRTFLIVGSVTVGIDLGTYQLARLGAHLPLALAKAIGFICGTTFAYFANRAWTFGRHEHTRGTAWRFAFLYTTSLGANVVVNSATIALLTGWNWTITIAFIMATGTSTVMNFTGMKFLVFNPARQEQIA